MTARAFSKHVLDFSVAFIIVSAQAKVEFMFAGGFSGR